MHAYMYVCSTRGQLGMVLCLTCYVSDESTDNGRCTKYEVCIPFGNLCLRQGKCRRNGDTGVGVLFVSVSERCDNELDAEMITNSVFA